MRNIAFFVLLVSMTMTSCAAPIEESSEFNSTPYEEAQFTVSKDPTKAVLKIESSGGLSFTTRSMTIYGDGRVETRKGWGNNYGDPVVTQIDQEHLQAILRAAVDHGLAEWDRAKIHAKQIENIGYGYAVPTDLSVHTITISLSKYRRGKYRVKKLEKIITSEGASFALKHYPPIRELEGIVQLLSDLHAVRKRGD